VKKVRHILGLSGGKDSAALAVYLHDKFPQMEYFFTDTHKEIPETYDFLDRLKARLGIRIEYLSADKGFDHFLELNNGFLPSAKQRWCTVSLKLKPLEEFIGNDEAISYVAIRADENRSGYMPTRPNIQSVFPFIEEGIDLAGVRKILEDASLGLPAYYNWRSRSGCFFCFFQRKIEWVGLHENHPDLFEQAAEYESAHSDGRVYTWNEGETLREIIARKEEIKREYEHRKERELATRGNKSLSDVFDDNEDACTVCAL